MLVQWPSKDFEGDLDIGIYEFLFYVIRIIGGPIVCTHLKEIIDCKIGHYKGFFRMMVHKL